MTQRKFKHKFSDLVAEITDTESTYRLYVHKYQFVGHLPKSIICSGGSDWEEITEPELQKGKWYVKKFGSIGRFDGDVSENGEFAVFKDAFSNEEYLPQGTCLISQVEREATFEEVKWALLNSAERLGYKNGVRVKSYVDGSDRPDKLKEPFEVRFYSFDGTGYVLQDYSGRAFYKDSRGWAEIIEEKLIATSYEGELIYNGDNVLEVFKEPVCDETPTYTTIDNSYFKNESSVNVLLFKDYNKAQEYIEYNKPRFSKKFVDNIIEELKCKREEFQKAHNTMAERKVDEGSAITIIKQKISDYEKD